LRLALELVSGERARGGGGYVRFAQAWIEACPDPALSVQHVEERNETMAEVYLLATGTHRGTLNFGAYRFASSGAEAVLHIRELIDIRIRDASSRIRRAICCGCAAAGYSGLVSVCGSREPAMQRD
jgi:hypothetical protein